MGKEDSRNVYCFHSVNSSGLEREVTPIPLVPQILDLIDQGVYCVSQDVGGADFFPSRLSVQ
jgi:hypothetical protein